MSKVSEFLQEQEKIIAADREKTLIALGLFEKEYSPNGGFSRLYPKYDVVDGEKHYYREVAITVTEEEWQAITEKTKIVSEIRMREEEDERKARAEMAKKHGIRDDLILPNFVPEQANVNEEKEKKGRSGLSFPLRIMAFVLALWYVVGGIIAWCGGHEEQFVNYIANAALNFLVFYALAEILDRLAMLTTMGQEGFHIKKR